MSKKGASTWPTFVPGMSVVGSSPILEKDHLGHSARATVVRAPLFLANGKPHGSNLLHGVPGWNPGKELGTTVHFRNAAARRRAGGDVSKADRSDVVMVPIYRGISARLANQLRVQQKRTQLKAIVERVKATLRSGPENDAEQEASLHVA